jgi:aminoglycoside phosphotransferase (APT) family kinase protein
MPALPIDEVQLTRRVGDALGQEVEKVSAITGGNSSLTYSSRVLATGQEIVVKSGVPGLEPVRNRDMLRQAKVHKALESSNVPVPRVLAEDPGEPPEIAPFFVMERCLGECVEVTLSPIGAYTADHVRGRLIETCRYMGELHRTDLGAVGLGNQPVVGLEQEIQRWKDALETCEEDLKAGTGDVYERLMAKVPVALPPKLLHGDMRTGNVLAIEGTVTAIIDWEIWSVSDPRIDLAWYLYFVEDEQRPSQPGKPTADELIDHYEAASGLRVKDLDWFRGLVRYKQTAAAAYHIRNARRRGETAERQEKYCNYLLTTARDLLGI